MATGYLEFNTTAILVKDDKECVSITKTNLLPLYIGHSPNLVMEMEF